MAWTVQNPINFVAGGAKTNEAIAAHIAEIQRIYILMNRMRKIDAGDLPPIDPDDGVWWKDTSVDPAVVKEYDAITGTWEEAIASSSTGSPPMSRYSNCILTAKRDANGNPSFLTAGTGLTVDADFTPELYAVFADGFSADYGEKNYYAAITVDVTDAWTSLPQSLKSYLYIDYNPSTGVITYGSSTMDVVVAKVAPVTPSSDQHWYNPQTRLMQRYSGSAWQTKYRIFVGSATTNTTNVTAIKHKPIYVDWREKKMLVDISYTTSTNFQPIKIPFNAYLKSVEFKNRNDDSTDYTPSPSTGIVIKQAANTIATVTQSSSAVTYNDTDLTTFTTGDDFVLAPNAAGLKNCMVTATFIERDGG